MNKPLLGLLLGGILGIFDGLSALISAPEVAPQIGGIVFGSTIKGLLTGLLIGFVAKRYRSLPIALVFGLAVGLFFAYLVALMTEMQEGNSYYWQIMLPGGLLGLIVGYATVKYGAAERSQVTRTAS